MNLILQGIKSTINGVYSYVNKNRLAWTDEPKEIDLIHETTHEWAKLGFIDALRLDPVEIAENATYVVYWDGVKYECVSYYSNELDSACVGNATIANINGDSNNEPFFVTVYEGTTIVFANSIGSHTFKVSCFVAEIHKIDNKYIDFPKTTKVKRKYKNDSDAFELQEVPELIVPDYDYAKSSDNTDLAIAYKNGNLAIANPYMLFATINFPDDAGDISNLEVNATTEIINSSNPSARKILYKITGTYLIYLKDHDTRYSFYVNAADGAVCNTMSGKWIKIEVLSYETGVKAKIKRIK